MKFLFPPILKSFLICSNAVCKAGCVTVLLTVGSFFLASASCFRGAESLLTFLLTMLSERSRYTVKSEPCGPDLTPPVYPAHCPALFVPPLLLMQVSSAGSALWTVLKVDSNQLCMSDCDISTTDSYCCVLSI